ncbi:MAG: carboxypeptidase regulatory-like domain-containing protein, partial [Pyrinomonadaceae bacterium]|nr:carboxypeptidase regulatory-like domain-containing protein [Pyrinomonadaceae bacterium]
YLPRLKKQFETVNDALYKSFGETGETPFDDVGLRRALASKNIDFNNLRDAWETPFRARFKVVKDNLKLEITSASADKRFDTTDDLTVFTKDFAYFQPLGAKITNAFYEYNGRTDDFITDYKTLRDEMKRQNVNLDDLRDAFGERYKFQFTVEGFNYSLKIESGGENRKFEPNKKAYNTDDFTIWTDKMDYFAVTRSKLSNALSKYVQDNQVFPNDENELREILTKIGFGSDILTDIYKRPFYIVRRTATRYADKVQITIVPKDKTATQTDNKPVTQQTVTYLLRSAGANGIKGDDDDFELASFTGIVTEQTKNDPNPKSAKRKNIATTNASVIQGTITDPNGAVVAGATVTATSQVFQLNETKTFVVKTDENGFYSLENLPSLGLFTLTIETVGFKRLTIENVQISGSSAIELDIALEIGSTLDTVEITSGVDIVNTTDSSLVTTVSPSQITELPKGANVLSLVKLKSGIAQNQQTETPRLREYFPETLVWQPELITDANGKASLKFKLADSLTTWKLAVIGSTVDGEIGVAEKEFQAFQPFFAELDPPKILTTGDKISLPVVLRNYLDTPQTVRATMTEASWFKLSGQSNRQITVAPNASQNAIFDFEAVAAIKNGKQRVTAIAQDSSDAIEKPVTVHPNGREISNSQTQIFGDKSELNVNFPTETLSKTQRAELKIYPNLSSHVVESVEGILERPHGCGEQTISSTYPSLLLLKLDESSGETTLKTRAKRYLQQGYERLSGYKASGGGFNYWGNGEADLALSVYALRFLVDAKGFINVDDDLINETRKWIIAQQQADGSWKNKYNRIFDANLTAYIARNLANSPKTDETNAAIVKALKYLDEATTKTNDAYILANIALAYFDAGRAKSALAINEKLRGLAKTEGDTTFWDLQSNTAFYGWGLAGRTETTALVIQAFSRETQFRSETKDATNAKNLQNDISHGLAFLLKQKDRYGVWYSTQATINVLDTLITLLQTDKTANSESSIEIVVNGNKVKNFVMSRADKLNNPLTLDLTEFLNYSNNRVEVLQNDSKSMISAQVVQNYYVAWKMRENGFRSNDSNGLRFQVDYDRKAAKINEEITCRVQAERVGFKGYGMILAEIGLPPGAEVGRESLKIALENNYNISSYEVLPDKIIVYMWATAGGTKFDFKFKPRYNIEANSAPSTAYDYYNPESQAVIAPTKFIVR